MFGNGFTVLSDSVLTGAASTTPANFWLKALVLGFYSACVLVLWVYGVHRYFILWWYGRNKNNPPVPLKRYEEDELPPVTVQLAVFNEMYVVERLLDAVAALDYPREKLQIQVLDDSTDETVGICRARVDHWAAQGLNIQHIHRTHRKGFKAGALAEGLETATGDFIVMFDADFVPPTDFIRRQIHHFSDPKVGFVQARWGHLNQSHSTLTELQALFLNGHFVLEHTGRQRSGRFFSFSGTAGTWRKACIADAGGWQHDTLVEDLDLSYRAQLKGWRGVYLVDQEVPAELPVDMAGFKSQQHRWAKGFIQAMKKLWGKVWASDLPLKVKLECSVHLTNNMSYLFMVALAVLMFPALVYRVRLLDGIWAILFDISIFLGATCSVLSFYAYAQRQIDGKWWKKIHYLPLLMGIAMGIALNQARAVIEALLGHESPFVRTPKYHVDGARKRDDSWRKKKYATAKNTLPYVELAFGLYFLAATIYSLVQGLWMAAPFMALFCWGFVYVGWLSLPRRRATMTVEAGEPGVAVS